MVVKTDICQFSEFRIYPGHGKKLITREGKIAILITKKTESFFQRKVKSHSIRWAIAWRRKNKKIRSDTATEKKRRNRVRKIQRAYVGVTLDELRKKQNEKPEQRQAMKEAAIREIKDRKAKAAATKKGPAAPKGGKTAGAAAGSNKQRGKK
jgi:large subunit ribosomal protein L24e